MTSTALPLALILRARVAQSDSRAGRSYVAVKTPYR
jgi:hypothetical protein